MIRYAGNVPDRSRKRYAEEGNIITGRHNRTWKQGEEAYRGKGGREPEQFRKKKKQSWGMYFIGGVASGYGGYLLNVCYQPGKDINYFLNRLDQVMAAPFANYWNENFLKKQSFWGFLYM